jgi:beta-lactamase superfamily II metal-dependent hydrolase
VFQSFKKSKKKAANSTQRIIAFIVVLLAVGLFIYFKTPWLDPWLGIEEAPSVTLSVSPSAVVTGPESMSVHFIDVGQGDCILVTDGEYNILIDTGDRSHDEELLFYLGSLNVDSIDMFVLTHPHEDHIGSAYDVLENYDVSLVLKSSYIATSDIYLDLEAKIDELDIDEKVPVFGEVFTFDDMVFTVISDPGIDYEDINNYSLILKLDHKGNTFLFTGDAEQETEADLIAKDIDFSCDVLKVGHHGGATSTHANFLFKASPVYAVIQVGADNSYGHPDRLILSRLETQSVTVYRNDLSGDIVCTSTDKGIEFEFGKTVR